MYKNDNTGHYTGALLEEIRDDIKRMLEGQTLLATVPSDVRQLKADVLGLKSDMKVVKSILFGGG